MATRGAHKWHKLQIDGEEVRVRYRRFTALHAALSHFDAAATLTEITRLSDENARLMAGEITSEVSARVREIGVELTALQERQVRFVHENLVSVEGLCKEQADGGALPYDKCTEDDQLWLIWDCWGHFFDLIPLIRNITAKEGEPDPEKSEGPGS